MFALPNIAHIRTAVLLSAAVHGRVTSAQGLALSGARLRLIPVDGDAGDARAAVTDSTGTFAWSGLSAGQYELIVRRIGYAPVDVTIALSDGIDRDAMIRLTPTPHQLDTVTTSVAGVPGAYNQLGRMSDFYARMNRGEGHFFTRTAIDSLQPANTADLFKRVAGVQATVLPNGSLTVQTSACRGATLGGSPGVVPSDSWGSVALYVDGVRVSNDNRANTMGALDPAEIEAVEIYRSPTELPAEAVGNACAAVYVWTRTGADP